MTVIEGHLNGNNEKPGRKGEDDSETSAANPLETNSKPDLHRVESQKQGRKQEEDSEKSAATPPVETKKTTDKERRISSRKVWRKALSDAEKSVSVEGSSGIACNSRDYLYIASTLVLGLALTLVLVYFTVLRDGPRKKARIPLQNSTELLSNDIGHVSPSWTTVTTPLAEQDTSTDTPRVGLFGMLDLIPTQPDSLPQSAPSNDSGNVSFSVTPLSTTETTTMTELVTGTDTPRVGLFDMLDLIPAQPDSLPQSAPSNDSGNVSFSVTPLSTTETTTMTELVTGTDTPRVGLFDMLDLIPAQPDSLPQSAPSNDSGNVSFSVTPLSTTETTTMTELVTGTDTPRVGLFDMLDLIPAQPDSLPQSAPSNDSGNVSFSVTPLSTTETTTMTELVTGTDTPRVGLFDMLDLIPAQPDSLPQSAPSNDSGNVSFSVTPLSTTETTTMTELVTDSDSPKKVGLFQILLPPADNSSQSDDSERVGDDVTTEISDTP